MQLRPILNVRLAGDGSRATIAECGDEVPPVVVLDLRDTREAEVNAIVSAEADRQFDLWNERPFRVVVAVRDQGAIVLLVAHHLFFGALAGPVLRLAGPDVPYACTRLETDYLLSTDRILMTIQRALDA